MTNTHKFTPSPWKIAVDFHDDDESLDYMCVVADGCVIANTILEDDARLIAAAPDLLAALQNIINANDAPSGATMGEAKVCEHYASIARAAIAKAEGA